MGAEIPEPLPWMPLDQAGLELWQRMWRSCPQLRAPHDRLMVSMLIYKVQRLASVVATIESAEAQGSTIVDVDPATGAPAAVDRDEWIHQEREELRELLGQFFIALPRARELGLWPLSLVDPTVS